MKVLRRRPGPDDLIGKDRSNRHGKWKVVRSDFLSPEPHGLHNHVYAKVVRREEGAAGTIFVCRGDLSPTLKFHG